MLLRIDVSVVVVFAKIKIQNQPVEDFMFNGNNWEIPYN